MRISAHRDFVFGLWGAIATQGAWRCAWAGRKRSARLHLTRIRRAIDARGLVHGRNARVFEAMRWGRQGQTAGGPIRRFPGAEFSRQGQYSAALKLEKTKRDSPRFACLRRGLARNDHVLVMSSNLF